jgi:gas vesicle protein
MNNIGRTTLVFLTGLGIGAGIAALFAPRSGEETREWIADRAERKPKVLRRGPAIGEAALPKNAIRRQCL